MTVKSGPGLLSQLNGRVAGSWKDASAPGSSLLRCCLSRQRESHPLAHRCPQIRSVEGRASGEASSVPASPYCVGWW
jgi:hypothetical protein